MGKKQSRQNRGARTGGHERSAAPETKEQPTQPTAAQDTVHSISEQVSHRKQRRFGHN
ncbi:hypothetical protein ACFTXM_26515 [Streptomyces sp. NPDC056930]|uniref:hypothetical protein n=1 Tax=unclassified Streptomyces TaxID=2593676 RepID=UPI00081D41C2|nr:hypothetical protein GA0115254_12875 [Streptomyces sp. Ncost-T10-10d]